MNGKPPERLQSLDGAESGAETPARRPSGQTTRTSGSDERVCNVCGGAVTGQRRNGFCSDRCRMKARRTATRVRVEHELAKIESAVDIVSPDMTDSAAETVRVEIWGAVDEIRSELFPGDGREER